MTNEEILKDFKEAVIFETEFEEGMRCHYQDAVNWLKAVLEKKDKTRRGWEGYLVVDPQSGNYKCSPVFMDKKEANRWRVDFGDDKLSVVEVDIALREQHEK